MAKALLFLILLCLATTAVTSEMLYIIRPSSPSQNYSHCAESTENFLTLSQFINNSSEYLTKDTRLTLWPGNYSLESELIVENVHSFSIFGWPASSSKVVIMCGRKARFEFRNVSTVTVSGLEFIGCLDNHVVSVGHFQLENSGFFGSGEAIVNGTVLSIEESVASLDRVAFVSAVEMSLNTIKVQELLEYCTVEPTDPVVGILLNRSNISITQSLFEGNKVGFGAVIYDQFDSDIMISDTSFVNNSAIEYCNEYCCIKGDIVYLAESWESTVKLYHTKFMHNNGVRQAIFIHGGNMEILHSKFVNNTVFETILCTEKADTITVTHSKFIDNTATDLIEIDAVINTVSFTEFINNIAISSIVFVPYYSTSENLTSNVFMDNIAAYEVQISPVCRPGFSLSLGSSRCIQCSKNWRRDLIGIVVAASLAGVALVTFMLAVNMTVAVGTLNGILFYANIVAANADTYFLPFATPNIVTVIISWLNLDIGFDVCFYVDVLNLDFDETPYLHKVLMQLAFPTYVILLVITVIVASECSSKFAKLIGEGNPVAVLATMILLSYAKLLSAVFGIFSLLYAPYYAFGSRGLDFSRLSSIIEVIETHDTKGFKAVAYSIVIGSTIIPLFCVVYVALVFSWKSQKLHHFLDPYHAPYTANHRYWTGLMLLLRILLHLISVLNFSLDTRIDLMAIILIIGGLILLKGVIAKRVYKSWLLDIMETAIYFNLVAFSALTWYNLDFGGNQVAVAYTSVMIIFILLLGVIVFHVLRYTRLYKCSFVEKGFEWTSSKLQKKRPKQEPQNDAPEELDGYQMERAGADDTELPTITHTVVEIYRPSHDQNQQEEN